MMFRLLVSIALLAGCTSENPGFRSDGSPIPASDTIDTDGLVPLPDGEPVARDLPAPLDAFGCKPGIFLGCHNPTTLERCNDKGTGVVLESCHPYLCNATHERCNQCDPTAKPFCSGDSVVSCSEAGLPVTKTCPDECIEGKCKDCVKKAFYKDGDGDGFGNPSTKTITCEPPAGFLQNAGDCDDADPDAHPKQQGYFTKPTLGQNNFDYNCDNWEQKKIPAKVNCQMSANGVCVGHGWATYVPGCGQTAPFVMCQKGPGGQGCFPSLTISFEKQPCR